MTKHKTHFRWNIIALLFVINAVNYLDRSSISYAIDNIAVDFGLNDDQIGLVLGAFGFGYIITTFLGGIAADKFGARRVLALSIIMWGLISLMTSASSTFNTGIVGWALAQQ